MRKKFVVQSSFLIFSSMALANTTADENTEVLPLSKTNYDTIMRSYSFVGDFAIKPETREVSEEIFWKYPFKIPKVEFDIDPKLSYAEIPSTPGASRAIQHINRGRVYYLKGDYEEARKTWLAARSRFGKTFPYHRRNDYYVGYAILNLAFESYAKTKDWNELDTKQFMANAATFLNWAYIAKVAMPDPLLEQTAPKGLYNLGAIYHKYGNFAGAYGAAEVGLDHLRRTGRKDSRLNLRRIRIESLIRNRSYLEAIQDIDTLLRQDADSLTAPLLFARAGDIYFDLNNYALAEDAYALAERINYEFGRVEPKHLVLRGESLFWMGRFSEAQKMFDYALRNQHRSENGRGFDREFASLASLRFADAFLARKQYEQAKLAYYRVFSNYRGTQSEKVARVRHACLELPYYQGKNIEHARKELSELKTHSLAKQVVELAWSCETASYAQHERSREMVERVRGFYQLYPNSKFLAQMAQPVREVQASQLDTLFMENKTYSALSFFEVNRDVLFPIIPPKLGINLFRAYSDVYRSKEAAEFWPYINQPKHQLSDTDHLRRAVVAVELSQSSPEKWEIRSRQIGRELSINKNLKIPYSKEHSLYLSRILAKPKLTAHYPWIFRTAKQWSETQRDYNCHTLYPVTRRIWEDDAVSREESARFVDELIEHTLPQILIEDESCGLSILTLEKRAYSDKITVLYDKYTKRKNWALQGDLLGLFWQVAESLSEAKQEELAKDLWQHIVDNGETSAVEVEFAAARLDPTRTESQKLWE